MHDLRIIASAHNDGTVGILSAYKMEVIRIIKVNSPVSEVRPMKYPFYLLYIQCSDSRQFCFTINGTKL